MCRGIVMLTNTVVKCEVEARPSLRLRHKVATDNLLETLENHLEWPLHAAIIKHHISSPHLGRSSTHQHNNIIWSIRIYYVTFPSSDLASTCHAYHGRGRNASKQFIWC